MDASEYYGLPIYSDKGNHVGEVKNVVLDLDKGEVLGLGFEKKSDKITTIPYKSVMAIGDIVIVRSGSAETKSKENLEN